MANGQRTHITVTGLRQVIDALAEVDKKAERQIQKSIRDAGKKVVGAAQKRITGFPVSGWGHWTVQRFSRERGAYEHDLSFDPGAVVAGFKVQRSNFRKAGVSRGVGYDVVQSNAAGSIFEVIGDGSRVTTPQGARLVNTINRRFGKRGPRILMPAYYEGLPANFQDDIRDKIAAAAREAGLI